MPGVVGPNIFGLKQYLFKNNVPHPRLLDTHVGVVSPASSPEEAYEDMGSNIFGLDSLEIIP